MSEALVFTLWLDTGSLPANSWVRLAGPSLLRSAVVAGVLLCVFGARRLNALRFQPRLTAFAAHAAFLGLFALFSQRMFGGDGSGAIVGFWLAAGGAVLFSALSMCAPLRQWYLTARALRGTFALVVPVAALAAVGGRAMWSLWATMGGVTFRIVHSLLWPVVPNLTVDFASRTIRSRTFDVEIAPECSGYEGIALVLLFGCIWLWINRDEYRFPRALLMLPVGAVSMFLLNAVRIAALFLIGHWGAPAIAAGGFHSQAGWIAFLGVTISLAFWSRRIAWMSATPGHFVALASEPSTAAAPEPTAVALAPFLAITAAAILTSAISGGFDWLYGVRFLAAASVLWLWRAEYRLLNWSISLWPLFTGALVTAVWLLQERLFGITPTPPALWPPLWWIALRVVAATITVPIAEELAFRHFLQRRLVSAAFTAIDPRRVPLWSVMAAAAIFGALHGVRWPAGVFAGVIFGLEYRRGGSIGAAALSHGVANALLAAYVLTTGNWQLW